MWKWWANNAEQNVLIFCLEISLSHARLISEYGNYKNVYNF